MRTIIYPYKLGSGSARLLAGALSGLRVRPDGRYRPRRGDLVINWGASRIPDWMAWVADVVGVRMLNSPLAVRVAANKLETFRMLQQAGVSIPEFTTDNATAAGWMRQGFRVYARHTLTGHSGTGIRVISPHPTITTTVVPHAPLYVKEIQNDGEYRVHVMRGRVIDYIKKRRRQNDEPTREERDVRNLENGWVYTRQNLRRLERIEQLAVDAVNALGLDFGAVDIIKDTDGNVYVLEVNTACGMSETTLESYVSAFTDVITEHANNTDRG